MSEKYDIRFWKDNEYAVYEKDKGWENSDFVFKGTLEEINAWMSLQEKGFSI